MKIQKDLWIIVLIIVIAAASRLLPESIANFSAVGAIAFMGGALFKNRIFKYLIPVLILALSDVVLNSMVYSEFTEGSVFYSGMLWVYLPFLLSVFIGESVLQKLSAGRVFGTAMLSGLVFFLLSNFGVWMSGTLYPKTGAGLIEAYTMGIPFFRNTLIGNVVFGFLIYGAYLMATRYAMNRKTAH